MNNDQDVIRTRAVCPRCGNRVAMRIDESGVTFLAHRVSRTSANLCR